MWLAGFVPFDSECAKCGKYVVHAGSYSETLNDNDPELKDIIQEFHNNFLCPECEQYRRRTDQTQEEYLGKSESEECPERMDEDLRQKVIDVLDSTEED